MKSLRLGLNQIWSYEKYRIWSRKCFGSLACENNTLFSHSRWSPNSYGGWQWGWWKSWLMLVTGWHSQWRVQPLLTWFRFPHRALAATGKYCIAAIWQVLPQLASISIATGKYCCNLIVLRNILCTGGILHGPLLAASLCMQSSRKREKPEKALKNICKKSPMRIFSLKLLCSHIGWLQGMRQMLSLL